MKKINFYSGPAILPQQVLRQAQEAIHDFAGTGLSILEISHRSKEFVKVMDDARALVKELMDLNNNYEVLFLQGGGSTQFCMVPMNLLNENETAGYLDTGQWAHSAMEEAKLFGKVEMIGSSRESNYTFIPKQFSFPANTKYLHLTSNNTIYGTQLNFPFVTPSPVTLVCDMSSDLFSRQMDYSQFDLIYASTQKNAGVAGTTIVVIKKNILGTVNRKIPKMLDYQVHINKESMHNTPSVFAVYVSYLTLQWIKKEGIQNIEARNIRKAKNLYDAIDASKKLQGMVANEDRSLMNVCFKTKDVLLEEKFIDFCKQKNIVGLKGYRTVGGFRASIYNAMPESGVQELVNAIEEFDKLQ